MSSNSTRNKTIEKRNVFIESKNCTFLNKEEFLNSINDDNLKHNIQCNICSYNFTSSYQVIFKYSKHDKQLCKKCYPPIRPPQSEETIQKIKATKAANPDKTPWNKGIKTGSNGKKGIKTGPNGRKGVKFSEEHCNNISKAGKERVANESEEVKEQRIEKIKQTWSDKVNDGWASPLKGTTLSDEHCLKVVEARKDFNKQQKIDTFNKKENAAKYQNIIFLNSNVDSKKATMQCKNCLTIVNYNITIFNNPNKYHDKVCPTCNPRLSGASKKEKELYEYINSLIPSIMSDRSVLFGKEIDILIPSKNIGFEFTGLYWHSELNKDDHIHHLSNKTGYAHNKGIKLITIFEDEWDNKKDICKSRIAAILGFTQIKIAARKCTIGIVPSKDKISFLKENHIQGAGTSSIGLGLYYEGELVSIATFKKTNVSKGGNGTKWELSRMCNKLNTIVMGGASKLIKYFMKEINTGLNLISYADRRWSTGDVYKKMGFNFVHMSKPNYWYMQNYKFRIHRFAFQKSKVLKMVDYEGDPKDVTEWELMQNLKYDRIWDCGTTLWELPY
jgi:hypothetical protein